MPKNILLLMMGGSGTRFGTDIPKQFIEVNGKPVFSFIVEKYAGLNAISAIVCVCHGSWVDFTREWIDDRGIACPVSVVGGGASRSESVKNGLIAARRFAENDDVILIHDATHPYVDEENLNKVIYAARRHGGATLGAKQYDTVYGVDLETGLLKEVIPRETVVTGASPEAFLFGKISDIYQNTSLEELEKFTSAGALALANGIPMEVVPTNLINLKITYRDDMETFKRLFYGYYF